MSEASPPRSRENTRARLLTAASEVFAESGFDGASVEAICERAGFTRGAFYSNFASKDELFFGLVQQVSDAKLERVTTRVRELESEGLPAMTPAELVLRVLDIEHEERLGVVLMSEIRTNAMRDRRLAAAYLEWDAAMTERVAQIIADLARTYSLRLRMPVLDAARFVLQNWDATCVHAVIAGLGTADTLRLVTERTAALAAAIAD
ncbi:TetR/AcrR family transcriptional regulator [Microbacterium sp. cx-55]|uniref:TetR/AcrR family transcriptional regulator n=1 Tax=Microbacterium sp. cx-55 TaxID=2875948 RepID=UPI001CC1171D|nr:TetR/AcrR family transcriptional regulator [Microbacterium sp. cx-55]UGB34732.1 TetR/AcrR family transcriptional regulator [Microbacterium sp. cx-55]